MLNRPEYKRLVNRLRKMIEEMKSEGNGLVSITKGLFTYDFRGQDFEESWPRALKEVGLVDDGSKTDTFTISGHGILDLYPEYKRHVR